MNESEKNHIICSFCGKCQHQVDKIVAGISGNICDQCILDSVDLVWPDIDENVDA